MLEKDIYRLQYIKEVSMIQSRQVVPLTIKPALYECSLIKSISNQSLVTKMQEGMERAKEREEKSARVLEHHLHK